MFYEIVLSLHNLMRWVVVIMAVVAVVNAFSGWFSGRTWLDRDRKIGTYFAISMDIQLLLGLLLYLFVSPAGWVSQLFSNFGAMMGNASGRFYGLEHLLLMVVAVILVHVGSSRARKAEDDSKKFRTAAIWFSLGTVVLLLGIPWPFLEYGRPWLRLPF